MTNLRSVVLDSLNKSVVLVLPVTDRDAARSADTGVRDISPTRYLVGGVDNDHALLKPDVHQADSKKSFR